MSDLFDFEERGILQCEDIDCLFTTADVQAAMEHVGKTGHSITGPGKLEGTTLTVSVVREGEEDDDDENPEIPVFMEQTDVNRLRLDKMVMDKLLLNPTPAKVLSDSLGLSWEHDARELRGSLLRLQEAGLIDVVYGLGWYKRGASRELPPTQ